MVLFCSCFCKSFATFFFGKCRTFRISYLSLLLPFVVCKHFTDILLFIFVTTLSILVPFYRWGTEVKRANELVMDWQGCDLDPSSAFCPLDRGFKNLIVTGFRPIYKALS